jgi:hypothetical protein
MSTCAYGTDVWSLKCSDNALISITNKSLSEFPNYATNNCPVYPVSFFALASFATIFSFAFFAESSWSEIAGYFVCSLVSSPKLLNGFQWNFFWGEEGWGAVVPEPLRTWVSRPQYAYIYIYSHSVWTVSCNLSGSHFVMVWPWCW